MAKEKSNDTANKKEGLDSKEESKKKFKGKWEHGWHEELKKENWRHCFISRKVSIFAVLLITVGFVALLQSFGILPNAWGKLWPLFLLVPGLILLFRSIYKK